MAMESTFTLESDSQNRLTLRCPGQDDAVDVRLRRAFPWSKPGRYISVRSSEGKELLLIEDLDALPAAQRQLIDRWLSDSSFIPRIVSIQEIDVRFGYQQWKVTTDRGPIEFRVQEREDIRFLPDGRFRIKDADGNVYEMPRVEELDEGSRRAIEPLI
jgi:hypothetical protein